jgi:hypothetical protein
MWVLCGHRYPARGTPRGMGQVHGEGCRGDAGAKMHRTVHSFRQAGSDGHGYNGPCWPTGPAGRYSFFDRRAGGRAGSLLAQLPAGSAGAKQLLQQRSV